MIAVLLATAQAPAAPVDAAPSDVTVVGSRMRKIRLSVRANEDGRITNCQATISSGDPAFDAQACEATRVCAEQGMAASDAMADCVDQRLIAFVKAQREGQGS